MKTMAKTQNASIINLLNCKNDEPQDLMNYDLLYYSSINFTMRFIKTINKTYPNVATINVITDFHKIKTVAEE